MRRFALIAVAASLAAAAAGCASAPVKGVHVIDAKIDRDHRPTYMGLPLATGQLVLSEAPGAYSFFFALVPERFYRFTHAAILVMEDGEPFVYDVTGRYKPGFDDRPTDAIVGGIRRTPFLDYCQPNLYVEVHEPPAGVDHKKVADFAQEHFRTGVQFDAYFRYDEHEKLFCTEFVALALEAGGAKTVELVPVRKNPSMAATMRYLAVPPDTCLPAGVFGDPERYVGAVGTFATRTAASCYIEAKREIHRRFEPDQKLGNLFVNDGGELILRDEIVRFLVAAVHLFDGARIAPSEAAIATAVRELADDTFGPMRPIETRAGEKHA